MRSWPNSSVLAGSVRPLLSVESPVGSVVGLGQRVAETSSRHVACQSNIVSSSATLQAKGICRSLSRLRRESRVSTKKRASSGPPWWTQGREGDELDLTESRAAVDGDPG